MRSTRQGTFVAYLQGTGVSYEGPGPRGLIVVHGDLHLSGVAHLPRTLIVQGSMMVDGSALESLPDRLVVRDNLYLNDTALTSLSRQMLVGNGLSLAYTRITQLPRGFSVQGALDVQDTPLRALPEGLDVGGSLNLSNTLVQRLPENLRVGQMIWLPPLLLDLHAFLRTRTASDTMDNRIILSYGASAHEKLHTHAVLAPFPDLLRVVMSMPDHVQLAIALDDNLQYEHHLYSTIR